MTVHVLTIDLEEWFHVLNLREFFPPKDWDNLERRSVAPTKVLLDLFDKKGVKATFFCLGWLAEREPDLIREIKSQGHEIASHGYSHIRINELGKKSFLEDLEKAEKIIKDITGEKPKGYRACSFSIIKNTKWAFELLAEKGYEYDSSVFPVIHPDYGWKEFPTTPVIVKTKNGDILEFPPLSARFMGRNIPFGGGGYFRLFPVWLFSLVISAYDKKNMPCCIYLHPWELDYKQPRVGVKGLKRFRHYLNLSKTLKRLESILDKFQFNTMESVLKEIRSKLPYYNI